MSASAVSSERSGEATRASAIAAVSTDGYHAPTTRITPAQGCIALGPGVKGGKVRLLQLRLGMGTRAEIMDAATIAAVQAFQVDNDLPRADGVVDAATWSALGISEDFCFDGWQAAPALPIRAGSSERIQTMLDFANGYIGAEYVRGGAGRPKYGTDCSGLVLQALNWAGLDPRPISIDKHVQPRYRNGYNLSHYPYLKHVLRSRMQRGDLIFYTSATTGAVNHVARVTLPGSHVVVSFDKAKRLFRLTDPRLSPLTGPARRVVRRLRGGSIRRNRLTRPLRGREMVTSAGLRLRESSSVGFRPPTFLGRQLAREPLAMSIDVSLRRRADAGSRCLSRLGVRYLVFARR